MALTADFLRFAYNHGDINVWHPLYERLIKAGGIGGNGIEVSNVGGDVNVGCGFAGIHNGVLSGYGAIEVTTAGTVDKSGGTAGLWHALEYSVSGTSVTWYLTALAGETDESFMSLTMKGYYDSTKQGYYRIASRRVLAFVFLRAALALGRIVNCESGRIGFKNIVMENYYDSTGALSIKYIDRLMMEIGDWNMNITGGGSGSSSKTVSLPFTFTAEKIRKVSALIRTDAAANLYPINYFNNTPDPQLVMGGVVYTTTTGILLSIRTGSVFDSAAFNATSFNRGWVPIEWET